MKTIIYITGLLISLPFVALAERPSQELTDLDFDALMELEITSVSKKSEKLSEAAAAVYVVTQDEIRRSGATSIPEALRLVPGVDAVQIDPNKWAVSIRGFNGRFANKLLVLIDGRSVYTPTYSGVYWEYLDYLMADIERIEIIRGPGATLWGTNAVNGVINIITKEATDTQGGLLSIAAGNELKGLVEARQGFDASENTQARVYVKGRRIDESQNINEAGQDNGGDYLQTGFRLDHQLEQDQSLTFQGNLYRDNLGQQFAIPTYSPPYTTEAVNDDVDALGGDFDIRWNQVRSLDSELSVDFNYDFLDHKALQYDEHRDTIDFSLQHLFSPFSGHEFVWGGGYRWSKNEVTSSELVTISDPISYTQIWNVFIQDTLRFPQQNISLTVGSKVEGNRYTGSEVQPNLRISWVPSNDLTLWGAVSRAKRTPSLVENSGTINASFGEYSSIPTLIQVVGEDGFESEQLDAYELGVRWVPLPQVSLDLAAFYNKYKNLRSYNVEYTAPNASQPYLLVELELDNNIKGHSSGVELLGTWQATNTRRFRFVYSYIKMDLEDSENNEFSSNIISLMSDRGPEHQVSLWGDFNLSQNVELDLRLYYTSERYWSQANPDTIDASIDADIRLAWQFTNSLNLSLVGHNLLHVKREQFQTEDWESPSLIERSVFVQAVFNW